MSNAAKYSEDGKTINIIIDEGAEGVRVRVLDSGPGIDEAEAARLFDLYYRSPATAPGGQRRGIGLYVCKVLVEAMGGRIWAMPAAGRRRRVRLRPDAQRGRRGR